MIVTSDIFHKNGFRLTRQRKIILESLTKHPQSISDICAEMKNRNIKIDQVTVYRSIKTLLKLGVVGKLRLNQNGAKFELLDQNHHHHLVCEKCGLVQNVPINDDYLIRYISSRTEFKINSHSFEFYGFCTACQKSK
jgi:Fur family transcriptional regulator, ferric uptake regulator